MQIQALRKGLEQSEGDEKSRLVSARVIFRVINYGEMVGHAVFLMVLWT
jgi:hypothetical protein